MEAYSPDTGKTYESWDELVAAETNGFAVVVVVDHTTDAAAYTFARTLGPFDDKKKARTAAATQRARWGKARRDPDNPVSGVSVHVEPLWKQLYP